MSKKSGLGGIMLAAVLGTIIVGPLWILFPLFEVFLKKGVRISIASTMMGAFAIKTPWIPYVISSLRAKFVLYPSY